MKKILILIGLLFAITLPSFADTSGCPLMLYCDHKGVDECTYEIIMCQSLIVNNLQLNEEQKKQMVEVFNTYGSAKAIIMNDLKSEQKELKRLVEDKASLNLKMEQWKKINKIKSSLSKIDKTIIKETETMLNKKQRCKYKTLQKSLF